MASKHWLNGLGILLGVNTLPAQSPAALHGMEIHEAEIISTVQTLEHHALTGLIATIVLLGLVLIAYLCHSCLRLNNSQPAAHQPSPKLLLLVFGLSVLCSQCSSAQMARASEMRAAQAVENRNCSSSHHGENLGNNMMNYQNPTRSQYPVGYFVTCKFCGQRVFIRR